ncbi:hypothetical protein CFP56_003039 [Quercus suber]|uniref:Uncharacterized protein n=1 Tax=Quercus suber TaxID=58331 RepID=A0AAW0LEN9_QUESU
MDIRWNLLLFATTLLVGTLIILYSANLVPSTARLQYAISLQNITLFGFHHQQQPLSKEVAQALLPLYCVNVE